MNETVKVVDIDPDGKKFIYLSRCILKNDQCEIIVDIQPKQFRLSVNDKVAISLQHQFDESEEFDYAMRGKLYKIEKTSQDDRVLLFVSFGGLLSSFNCAKSNVRSFELHQKVYLLMKRE